MTYLIILLITSVSIFKLYLNYRQKLSIINSYHKVPTRFQDTITLQDHQKAGNYTVSKLKFNNAGIIMHALLMIIFTYGGLLQFIDNNINIDNQLLHGIIIIAIYVIISFIYNLPFDIYNTFVLEAKFGFNYTTLKLFIADIFKSLIIGCVIAIPLLIIILKLMDIANVNWWLYVWLVIATFNLLILFLYPKFIAPLFNKFTPLQNDVLKLTINKLLQKCGFNNSEVFVMDGSKRSAHGNAYFTGFGKTKRIVFFDTLLKQLTNDEIGAILAHELGHFKKNHIIKQMIVSFLMTLGILYILSLLINNYTFYNIMGVNHMANYNALLLFMIALEFVLLPLKPLMSFLSRKYEFEADNFAKTHTNKDSLINGLVKLYKENASTLTPDILYSKFYYSHPTASIRIANLELEPYKNLNH